MIRGVRGAKSLLYDVDGDDKDDDDDLITLTLLAGSGTQANTAKTSSSGLIGGVYGVTIAGMVRGGVTGCFIKLEEYIDESSISSMIFSDKNFQSDIRTTNDNNVAVTVYPATTANVRP